jgi:hypothetical protein
MTEEEAKTKWCPFARVIALTENGREHHAGNRVREHNDGGISFRDDFNPRSARCIGSACMAWRWLHKECRVEYSGNAEKSMLQAAVSTNRIMRKERGKMPGYDDLVLDGIGYCGLAGKP